jgi:hypothetical protein
MCEVPFKLRRRAVTAIAAIPAGAWRTMRYPQATWHDQARAWMSDVGSPRPSPRVGTIGETPSLARPENQTGRRTINGKTTDRREIQITFDSARRRKRSHQVTR